MTINGVDFGVGLVEDWLGPMQWNVVPKGNGEDAETKNLSNEEDEVWLEYQSETPLEEEGEKFITDPNLKLAVINRFGEENMGSHDEGRNSGNDVPTLVETNVLCMSSNSHVSTTRDSASGQVRVICGGPNNFSNHLGPNSPVQTSEIGETNYLAQYRK